MQELTNLFHPLLYMARTDGSSEYSISTNKYSVFTFVQCVKISWGHHSYFYHFETCCFGEKRITKYFNPSPNKPWFLFFCKTSLFKTLWVQQKLLENEQFLLFQQCFLHIWKTLPFSSNLKLLSANSFSLETS